jgi:hypothetical protein
MLGDLSDEVGQLGGLTAPRLGIAFSWFLGQRRLATRAGLGPQRNDLVHAGGGEQLVEIERMSSLSARLAARLAASGFLRRSGRKDGGSARRLGPFVKLARQGGDFGLKCRELGTKLGDRHIALEASWASSRVHDDT